MFLNSRKHSDVQKHTSIFGIHYIPKSCLYQVGLELTSLYQRFLEH
jgi:hypothetical protein